MNFADAIRNTSEISRCLEAGLQALGSNSNKIKINSTRELAGSVDIDNCLKHSYPGAHLWDYVFGYKDHIYYVEVHPGSTGEVKTVIEKLNWLKLWRRNSSVCLETLRYCSSYHWLSSGKTAITKKSKYSRELAQNGILGPSSSLKADKFL